MTDPRTDGGTDESAETDESAGEDTSSETPSYLEYGIDDKPPIGESILLGVQHYLTMIGATIAIPLVLIGIMSQAGASVPPDAQAELIGMMFVVSGVATLAQTTIGNRYPLVQGGTFALIAPAAAIIFAVGARSGTTYVDMLLHLQGAIIAAALVEVVVGYAGIMGRLKDYMSPVVIAPTIALIGLALFGAPQITSTGQDWWLLGLTLLLITAFSQYLGEYSRYARLFPVLLGIVSAWLFAAILTAAGIYTQGHPGYIPFDQVTNAQAIQVVTPLNWGQPKFEVGFAIGMFAGVVASMIESFGDYHAVARLSGASAPSRKRINHGIGMEGLGNVFAGIMGTGNGSTSYSENIGAIGITGVASRYVVQVGAVVMLVAGFIGYFGQLVATLPSPIVGGLFLAMFGQIAAVGLSNLQYVDLNSSRNVYIIGIALFAGLAIPSYMGGFQGPGQFQAGMAAAPLLGPVLTAPSGTWLLEIVSATVFIVGSTGMAVGGLIAFVLDNTVPGTREERGLEVWEQMTEDPREFRSIFDRLFGSGEEDVFSGE